MKPDFWSKLDRYPPLVVRLLACKRIPGKGKIALTDEEIAERSGLALSDIKSISWLASWDTVPMGRVKQFSEACGVYFTSRGSMRTISCYLNNRPSYKYLRKSPMWKGQFQPMINLLLGSQQKP
jgi:hypothetical protein